MDASHTAEPKGRERFLVAGVVLMVVAIIAGLMIVWSAVVMHNLEAQVASGVVFTVALLVLVRMYLDPDSVRARQSDAVLKLSSQMLACMKDGLNRDSAQQICQLLLPATAAIAVAITDKEHILGYAGYNERSNPQGAEIRTKATHATVEDGQERVLLSPNDIGLPDSLHSFRINAAIIVPLTRGRDIVGTLKFYYRKPGDIGQTQRSMADGFGELLSTQMAATALEEQQKLATSMELKALQAQINPHFLFNTINTIASFTRTDPDRARELLREFAKFYRSTLEDAQDLIPLNREVEQVERYFTFEVARFGEDRLELKVDVDPEVGEMPVPSFMIQPLVENAVRHARPSEGKLTITVSGHVEGDDIVLGVRDDGVGMSEETRNNIMHPNSGSGLGIAVKNVRDRMKSYFGPESRMEVQSQLGRGTLVSIVLKKADAGGYIPKGTWGSGNSAVRKRG